MSIIAPLVVEKMSLYREIISELLPPRREAGMTMIELLVSLGVVAVLAAVALPNLASFNGQLKASGDARLFASHFSTWRAEAVRRREPVLVSFIDRTVDYPAQFTADLDGDNNPDEQIQFSKSTELITDGTAIIPNDILINGLGIAPDIAATGLNIQFENGGERSSLTLYRTGIITFN